MTIACLGWGSLIWQPKTLPVNEADWFADGPKLPLEFARHSGEDRITLVVMQDGPAVPVCWCKLPYDTLAEAVIALTKRENTKPEWIGRWPDSSEETYLHCKIIESWAVEKGLSGVVWAALPPRWDEQNGSIPSLEDALAHLRSLGSQEVKPAIEYILRAPAQIKTPYRAPLEDAVRDRA